MPTNRLQHLGAVGLAVTVGLAATSGVASAPATGSRLVADATASSKIALVDRGSFVVACSFSHRNHDDPIVFPRQPGRSHDHTYFGNRSTNAFSTPASLRKHRRTPCHLSGRADFAAYWAPTLFTRGRAVKPLGLLAFYVRRTHARVDRFPAGLKMIAGDMNARSPQPRRVTSWSCANEPNFLEPRPDPGSKRGARIPDCDSTVGVLRLQVNFPNCWDGSRLDSANHKSHMAYSAKGACTRSHSVEVPALTLFVYYNYGISDGPSSELSSGGQFSAHADFVNAWKQAGLAALVNRYLNHVVRKRR
jgi:Domain of unknown function (DUF1996)